ncbi:MAG: D-2-hydroxyacid dehydrogenase [Simkania sp.]|nr:D-2-hydroxyacid dehydrogenase [Simkania sp.]
MRAVFVDAGTFGEGCSFDILEKLPLEWRFFDKSAPEEIVEHTKDAEIALTNKAVFSKEIIRALPRLKMICVTATGVDCVDLAAAREADIVVCNVTDYSKGTVTQLTILFLLALANSFYSYIEDVKKGCWQKQSQFCFLNYPIKEVRGKTLGILGYGNLGQEVERVAVALGMQVLVVERKSGKHPIPGALSLQEVLKRSDFFTIHTPLTPETKNLIGKEELGLMKKTAYVINVSRGGIIDEEALVEALRNHEIAGAALDVLTKEPPLPNHPLLDPSIPNLLLTPHIGWASSEARLTILEITRDNVQAYLEGTPKNQVTVKR